MRALGSRSEQEVSMAIIRNLAVPGGQLVASAFGHESRSGMSWESDSLERGSD